MEFKVGERLVGRDGRRGTVVRVNDDGSLQVVWDDGRGEVALPADVRRPA